MEINKLFCKKNHFLSDDKAANPDNYILKNIHYGGIYNTYEYPSNMYAKAQALKFPLLFTDPWRNFRLNVATWNQQNEWWPIVCEMPVNPNNGSRAIDSEERKMMMVTLARHACLRDSKMIEDKVKGQQADIESLMKIKIPIEPVNTVLTKLTPEGFYDWDDVKRAKWGAPDNNITSQTMDLVQKIHNRLHQDVRLEQEADLETATRITNIYLLWKRSNAYEENLDFHKWLHSTSNNVMKGLTDEQGKPVIVRRHAEMTEECFAALINKQVHEALQFNYNFSSSVLNHITANKNTTMEPWLKRFTVSGEFQQIL